MVQDWPTDSDPERADDRAPLVCVECGARATLALAEREGWRCHSDGLGELLPFCPDCHAREFGMKP